MMATEPRETPKWRSVKKRALKRDQYRCQNCRLTEATHPGVDLQVHHVHAIEDGGGDELDNVVVVCNKCHWKLHRKGPEDGRYPLSLISGPSQTVSTAATRRENHDLRETEVEILDVLIENGPTQRKEIIEETGLSLSCVKTRLQTLMIAGYAARVERGVYGYITEGEYWRAEQDDSDGQTFIEAYDPEQHELINDPREAEE